MTAEVQRRGGIRPISDLPSAPAGSAIVEVEVAGAAYQAAAGSSGGVSLYGTYVAFQAPLNTAAFADAKGHAVTITNVTLDSVNTLFGEPTAAFDLTSQLAYTTLSPQIQIRAEPYTIEGWFRSTQAAQQYTALWGRDASLGSGFGLFLNIDSAGDGKVGMFWGAGESFKSTASGFNDGAWHHVAVTVTGLTHLMFVDGVVQARTAYAAGGTVGSDSTAALLLGNDVTATRHLVGNMANWRFTYGIPVYTVNFAVPTAPFPTS